ENLAVSPAVKRPAIGGLPLGIEHAVLLRDAAIRIAEDRIIGAQRFGEFLILVGRVIAGREIGYVVIAHFRAVILKRGAFLRAPAREGPREPGHDDRLFALEF